MIALGKSIKSMKESPLSLWRLRITNLKNNKVRVLLESSFFLPETSEMGTEVLSLKLARFSLSPLLPPSATSASFLNAWEQFRCSCIFMLLSHFAGRHSCLRESFTQQQRRKNNKSSSTTRVLLAKYVFKGLCKENSSKLSPHLNYEENCICPKQCF